MTRSASSSETGPSEAGLSGSLSSNGGSGEKDSGCVEVTWGADVGRGTRGVEVGFGKERCRRVAAAAARVTTGKAKVASAAHLRGAGEEGMGTGRASGAGGNMEVAVAARGAAMAEVSLTNLF